MLLLAAVAFAHLATPDLAPQDPQRFPGFPKQDAKHYRIIMNLAPKRGFVSANVEYTFTALEPIDSIRLHAEKSADWVPKFLTSPQGGELETQWLADSVVVVKLPKPVGKGDEIKFWARLMGKKPVDGLYFKKNRYGDMMAFTDHYSIRARGWLPCVDHPGDRAKFTLDLTYPAELEAVAFGVQKEPAPTARRTDRRLVQTSDAEIPPYMFAFVVGPLARVPEKGNDLLVDHLVYLQDREKAERELVHHAAWIAAMEKAFGRYPYGKYMTVQCPTRWGGFEAPGNVQLAEGLFDTPGRGQGTLAHELVHMWFGDAVGYSEWREVWLSEGFASYFGPWLHAQTGGPNLSESMAKLRTRWRKSFEGRTKSIRDDTFPHPDQALNSNTYPKGAWVLHMLRGEVGDAAFFGALRAYVDECRSTSVITKDFVRIIERETKTELSRFFDQWLDGIGCPELKVDETDDGIRIKQVQKGKPYRFWLRLRWRDGEGKQIEKRLRIDGKDPVILETGRVTDVELDPRTELLFRRAK